MPISVAPRAGHQRLYAVSLTEAQRHHRPYNHATIIEGARLSLAPPHHLSIESYGGEYIIYHWASSSDTQSHVHTDTLEEAFERCTDQFGLLPGDWVRY